MSLLLRNMKSQLFHNESDSISNNIMDSIQSSPWE
jgi:hypothetical protein